MIRLPVALFCLLGGGFAAAEWVSCGAPDFGVRCAGITGEVCVTVQPSDFLFDAETGTVRGSPMASMSEGNACDACKRDGALGFTTGACDDPAKRPGAEK